MYDEYIKQWKHYRSHYGDQTCLFLMVGRFYELYDVVNPVTGEGQTNVKQAVEVLGITLTVRKGDGPKKEDCYFAGFPEPSLQKFAAMLTREGWTVVVCDQQKDEKGTVTGRPVSRIFSPGTHIETAGAEAPYLAGLWLQEVEQGPPTFSAVVMDMTTGSLVSYEGATLGNSEIWSADSLVHFFQIHPPRELVVWWRGAAFARPSETILRRRCGLMNGAIHMELATEQQQGTFENAFVRKSYLERVFHQNLSLLPIHTQLHIQEKSLTERALVSLLSFAEQHFPSAIQNLVNHTAWSPESSMYMGNNTLYQLNYITQGQEQSVLQLFGKTHTSLGKRALRERLLFPSSKTTVIQERLNQVEFAYHMEKDILKRLESSLRFIHDIARLHRKIVMYSVTANDILALDTSYGCIWSCMEQLEGTCLEAPETLSNEFDSYRTQFGNCFDIEKAKQSLQNEEVSFLPDAKAPKTKLCEDKLKQIQLSAKDMMETLRQWVGLPEDALRLEVSDALVYSFSGTKTTLAFVKDKCEKTKEHPFPGITIHSKKTGRGSVECPVLERLQFETFAARAKFQAAQKEELAILCREIQNSIWSSLETYVGFLDVSLTLARVAKERGYAKPTLVESSGPSGFSAKDLRHPLLEAIQSRTEYVKHSISLGFEDSDAGLLLYGMNASGKSSLMKAIGICILLAQSGSFVPATDCRLVPFQSILTRILNQDNLWAGLSSFAVEVAELRDIFHRASSKSLVLGDELCSGTESVSATSLVAAGIHYLHSKEARFVFATHLHDLLSLSAIRNLDNLGIWHLRVHYDAVSDTLIYDRTLHRGPGGTLYGLEVARAMHLSHDILKQAHQFRTELLGERNVEEAKTSSYNANILIKECGVCKHAIVKDLEVHHIRPQKDAEGKQFSDGSKMNDTRNLIVVCQSCHDKYHTGEIEIGPEKQTSKGPQREIVEIPKSSKEKPSKWTFIERATIERYLKQFKALPLARIAYDLQQQEHLYISEATLRKMRSELH